MGNVGKVTVDLDELEEFLWYLQDKAAVNYREETRKAVRKFIEEQKAKETSS